MRFVGKKRFQSKDGKIYNTLFCLREPNEFDIKYSLVCEGELFDTKPIFVPEDVFDKLTKKDLNKDIEFITSFDGARHNIVDVKVVS